MSYASDFLLHTLRYKARSGNGSRVRVSKSSAA